MDRIEIGQLIQHSLTPGIMISSSALFLLGLQNRFSNLFSRFRLLNHERRTLEQNPRGDAASAGRLTNVIGQLDRLLKRVHAVKNAIFSFYAAILFFIGTCLCLFFSVWIAGLDSAALFFFCGGLVLILAACLFMIREIALAYHILSLERLS